MLICDKRMVVVRLVVAGGTLERNSMVPLVGGQTAWGKRQLIWTDIVSTLSIDDVERHVLAVCLEPQETRFKGTNRETLWWSTGVWLSFTQQMCATPRGKVETVSVMW